MTYAYYSPPLGTVPNPQPLGMPAGSVTCAGEQINAVVACDLGRAVVGVVGGVEAWRRSYPSHWPRAIETFEGLLFIGRGAGIEVVNPRTGYIHAVMNIPSAPANINGLRITRSGGQLYATCCFDMNGTGSVRVYTMNGFSLAQAFVNPFTAYNPRCAEICFGWVFVCDTFNHLFYAVDVASGGLRVSTSVYFPNHVQMLDAETALITAEHENRIARWKYTAPESFTLDLAAPVAPFNNPTKRKAFIEANEAGTLNPSSAFTPKKSMASTEAQGSALTIYSPNSARLYGSDMLVSDTDNHRVILVRGGAVVSELSNFNNPVTSVLF